MNSTFDYENFKLFFIGKEKVNDEFIPLVYQNKDLLTHAIILGMTGSGKTGLGITLLEEASIDEIPSIIIDPKGDMTNLLLNFPNLDAKDFEPWLDENEFSNNNLSKEEYAKILSETYKKGITKDFQELNRIQKLKDSSDFTIFTPGSNAGVQISILSSFKAPSKEILEDNELFISIINSTVHSILSLVENSSDETSKESILLSSIFQNYFKDQKDLTLEELINLIVAPPFSKIGVFDLETFFSKNDRLKFALNLNKIIASPSFSSWIEGESLDISKLLLKENNKSKVNIFSIAHLNDKERMFFVTILLNQILTWMRRQEGTSSLKALLYMDEIFGYFPPQANPPSKQPMLTLLKQARSFGVGIILSTQNPVDIDYKGLSNIGTWFIGKLQTKQDISKVLDGMSSASDELFDKSSLEKAIQNLAKRNFILKNINEKSLKIFETRWALSYLKGPLSKNAISFLMKDKKSDLNQKKESFTDEINLIDITKGKSKPIFTNDLKEFFEYKSQNNAYYMQAYLLLSSKIHFINSSRNIDLQKELSYKIYLNEKDTEINFEELEEININIFETKEKSNSFFYEVPSFILNQKDLKNIERSFTDFLYRNINLTLYKNDSLKLFSKQNESLEDFKLRVQDRLNENIDSKIEDLKIKFEKENSLLEKNLSKLDLKLQKERQELISSSTNTIISIASSVLGAFFGNKKLSSSKINSGSRNSTKILKDKNDLNNVQNEINILKDQQIYLQNILKEKIELINENNNLDKFPIEEYIIKPKRSDIFNTNINILWIEQ
ncbi:AAA-like domain protein [Aliarcobacter thereius]|uniref:ATP-binding protein n=1 Tax=Aliarcobacter thereius TaxID=544718 RepID=A0A5R9GWU7_9BACT|nr:DUF87 domain-containing protein [Aliarcobacter thereius]OCL86086.1 AAA-like domain protein [Aliarcobacter thereius]TLS71132.1 ATP-binding protein [Aliarcobacter thereius]TLT06736.1 ATP-binding protein [Aliarcobacter thereius]